MSEIQAFPEEFGCEPGMTLRDYFAAKAMQALLHTAQEGATFSEIAMLAYDQADQMLKERNK